jgi:prepilin-type N-terminal cleavage/methylation domain-containing protein
MALRKTIPAFTLIELAIVLMIIGVIAGAIFKGQDLLETAKARAVLNDFNHLKVAVQLYQEAYSSLPGDDPVAKQKFSQTKDGDGNGFITNDDAKLFWEHLYYAGYISSSVPLSSKFGGKYSVVYKFSDDFDGHWLMLGKERPDSVIADGPLLTPKQAMAIKSRSDDGMYATNPNLGSVRITEGKGVSKGQCVKDNKYLNLETKSPVCIVLVSF